MCVCEREREREIERARARARAHQLGVSPFNSFGNHWPLTLSNRSARSFLYLTGPYKFNIRIN